MNILFVTGYAYLPQLLGGMQSTTDRLCRLLLERGHKVAVLAGFRPKGVLALACKIQKKILRRRVSRDTVKGYPVWRAWFPWDAVDYVAARERPDVIVCMSGNFVRTALAARRTKAPVVMQMHDVEFHTHGGDFAELGNIPCVAVSRFVADKYRAAFGVDPQVIHPLITAEKCRTTTTKENVTFINPSAVKGVDLALKLARLCPEIPFTFVETWTAPAHRRELMQRIADLPNVILSAPQNDMRKVYGKCKILLAPSMWEEAYGMVVTEAQTSAIPVVASTRGGLPEAVGPGGILLDPEGPIDDWANSLRKLWKNDDYYTGLSAAALAHAQRPEMNPARQTDAWEHVLQAACGRERKTI